MKRWLPALILLLATAAVAGFIYKDRIAKNSGGASVEDGAGRPNSRRFSGARPGRGGPVSVLAAAVEKADIPVYLHGVGTVQAYNRATVRAQVTGRLITVEFEEGRSVNKGDVLARIDPARYQAAYDQAVAKKAMNEAALANAEADLKRLEKLARAQYSSEQATDAQRAQVEQLRAQLRQDQAAIDSAKTDLDHTIVVAPISGRTGIRAVDLGNLVTSGDADGIVTISQLQPISVVFTLPEIHIGDLIAALEDGTVALQASLGGKPVADGTLAVIDNRIDESTGTIRLKGTFSNEPVALWPGQYVSIRLNLKTLKDATVIPIAAIQQGPSERYVYRIQPDGTVKLTPVEVAREDEHQAVIAAGVEPGDRVATSGFTNLQDGAKVIVDDGNGNGNGKGAEPARESEKPVGVSGPEPEQQGGRASRVIGSAKATPRDADAEE